MTIEQKVNQLFFEMESVIDVEDRKELDAMHEKVSSFTMDHCIAHKTV